MPTLLEWQASLYQQYQVSVESDATLCDDVVDRQDRRDRQRGRRPYKRKDLLIPWPPQGQKRSFTMRPIDVLHALGRITTPPITELVDLSSTWAEIRYIWAFRPNGSRLGIPPLRLSEAVKDLDFHQKTLLSDELGVAFATLYLETCEGATDPVDTFVAMRRGGLPLRGRSRQSLPDYIFRAPGVDNFFIVECKGSQSSRSQVIGQLQRGSEQVMNVDVTGQASITRLVIASWLQGAIGLLVIDPDDDSDVESAGKAKAWSPLELQRFASAKMLTYIGDHSTAREIVRDYIERPRRVLFEPSPLVMFEESGGRFVGSQRQFTTPDGYRLRIFRGVDERIYETLRQGGRPGSVTSRASGSEGNPAASFLPDGSILRVLVSDE